MLHNGSLSSPKMMMGMRMVLVVGSGVTEGSRDKDEAPLRALARR